MHTSTTGIHEVLGPSIASYGPRKRRWRESWIWPLPGFILACILIITGLDWYYYGYTQYGPAAARSWSQDWLFWGILLVVITILITIWQIFRARVRVNVFRSGIEIHLPRQSPLSLRWDDILGISSVTIQDKIFDQAIRTRHQLLIFVPKNKPIAIDDRVGNLLELTTRLKAKLYPRLLPGFRARFQEGRQLSFGPVSVSTDSIMIRDRKLAWEQISRITVLTGNLVIETNDQAPGLSKKYRFPVIQIPNLELLLQVLQRSVNQSL